MDNFSMDDMPDPFWPPSPRPPMNRIPSEWLFDKFFLEASAPDLPSPIPSRDDDVVEIKRPDTPTHDSQPPRPSDLPPQAEADPGKCAVILKQKLDMYCAAVAMTRVPGVNSQVSSLARSTSQSLDVSQLGSQTFDKGNYSKVQNKVGGGLGGVPAAPAVSNSGGQVKSATSESSREQSDDDDIEGELEITENMDPADAKRVRRMLSNRESARRSRRRKQAHLSDLEGQVSQLRVENSSLLKRLTDANQKYNEAAVDNRILKADVETLRAKVKMAEDAVKRATSVGPMFPTMSDVTSISMPFSRSPSEVTSDAAASIQDDPTHFFPAPAAQDRRVGSSCLPEIAPAARAAEGPRVAITGGKMGRTASMQRVASLEHLQKRICEWDPDTSRKQSQV